MDPSELARALGSLPKARRYARVCPICGKEFVGTKRAVYCNPLCTAKAQTRRKTAARRARWVGTKWENTSQPTE